MIVVGEAEIVVDDLSAYVAVYARTISKYALMGQPGPGS